MMHQYKYRNPVKLNDGDYIQADVQFVGPDIPEGLKTGVWYTYVCAPVDDPESISMDLYKKCLKDKKLKKEKPPTQKELDDRAAKVVREQRRERLTSTDWTQLPDVPETTRLAWADYRQALRDVTKQRGFPHTIRWPEAPDD